jgi:signal transduction histidine kinase
MAQAAGQEIVEGLQGDLEDVQSMPTLGSLLEVLCRATGMGFSAVARVTDTAWIALAVRDALNFGLLPGQGLDLHTTLCKESRAVRLPILIEQASADPTYREHHTPRMYGFESYVSVPIVFPDGTYFGNLCALDPRPAAVLEPHVLDMFVTFSKVIGDHVWNARTRRLAEAAVIVEQAQGVLREQYLAVLAHDLRNPLASITTGLEVLQRAPADAALVAAMSSRMSRSAVRMKALVDDVMDYSRGRFGAGVLLERRRVPDLDDAFTEVMEELRIAHPDRELSYAFTVDRAVHCDRPRLQQLLSNLVINALTHGDASSPVLAQAMVVDEDAVLILVANDGEAIPETHRASLFDAFSIGGTRSQGLGLGLFICAEIAKGHGGSIEVSSSPGSRTVFRVMLPAIVLG